MPLKTKCIKAPRVESDGLRISVMSRHTLSDGITPDGEITEASFDAHWVDLAPPAWLVGAYYKQRWPWEEFEKAFRRHLTSPVSRVRLGLLVALARTSDVTIMCVEPTPECCHRRLIAEACRVIDPNLEIVIE